MNRPGSTYLGLTFQRFNISQAGHFIASTLYKLHIQLNISQVGRFIVRMSHWQDVSYRLFISRMTFHGQNLYQEYISQAGHFTKGHFLDRTFHWQCISLTGRYTGRTFHWQDISQTGHFTGRLSIDRTFHKNTFCMDRTLLTIKTNANLNCQCQN